MSLNVRLNNDYEQKLAQILAATRMDKSTFMRKMIDDQWLALQAGKTFIERRGGHPKYLLNGSPTSSERKNRKAVVAAYLEQKAKRRRENKH